VQATEKSKTSETHAEQLERLRREVEALRAQLQHAQRLATVGTMTAMVAHEFNNILTPIVNYAQMAREDPRLLRKAIDRAAAGGQRATDICRALLDMTAQGPSSPEPVRLADLVADVLSAVARDPRRDGIELAVDVPEDLLARTRRVELHQVLTNLFINAREAVLAATGQRRIDIAARRGDHDNVLISVRDTGVGIAPENLPRIFEPFFTTRHDAARPAAGHGLGLAICKDIVAALGGEISVDSAVGRGATFTVRLPA
jgi:signal transduction histidine kinase